MTRFRNGALALPIILLTILLFILPFRGQDKVVHAPLTEDAYYALSVSRNIALGNGLTIDGEHRTNGFQPFYTVLMAPLYLITGGERHATLPLVLLALNLVVIATGLVTGKILRKLFKDGLPKPTCYLVGFLIALMHRALLEHQLNGLETGMLVLMYLVVLLTWLSIDKSKMSHWVLLSAMMGLTVLTRIDAAIFAAIFGFYAAVDAFLETRSVRSAIVRLGIIGAVSFLVSSPWWLYNLIGFGSLMPSSGTAQTEWAFSMTRSRIMIAHVVQDLTPSLPVRFKLQTVVYAIFFIGSIALLLSQRKDIVRDRLIRQDASKRLVVFLIVVAFHGTILMVYYSASSWATYFYGRYLAPVCIISIMLYAILAAVFLKRKPIVTSASLIFLSTPSLIYTIGVIRSPVRNPFYDHQLPLIEEHVPLEEKVAASQTGTLGYFRDHVVNMDGKVNAEVLERPNHRYEYLLDNNINWFCDWPMFQESYFGEGLGSKGWVLIDQSGEEDWSTFELWTKQ